MPTLEYPPVDFPVYGMDETWAGPRWLDHLEGAGGEPLIGVWLAHGPQLDLVEHPGPWARVVTVPRRRWPAERGRDPVSEVAFHAWLSRGAGANSDVDQALSDAADHREWATAEWLLDGVAVEASLVPDHPDAHGTWAGFTAATEAFIVVVARGVQPADVRLTSVGSAAAYHTDLTKPLGFPDSMVTSRERALGTDA